MAKKSRTDRFLEHIATGKSRLRDIAPSTRYGAKRSKDTEEALERGQQNVDPSFRPPSLTIGSDDDRASKLFPGDLDRARRLHRAYRKLLPQVAAVGLHSAELRTVLQALIAYVDPAKTTENAAPDKAPALWTARDLNLRENAPQFIARVYKQWLGQGLARKDIARLDPDLYKALSVWVSRHPDDEIVKLLPAQSDMLDDLIERLSAEYPVEVLRKLGYAIDARIRRSSD